MRPERLSEPPNDSKIRMNIEFMQKKRSAADRIGARPPYYSLLSKESTKRCGFCGKKFTFLGKEPVLFWLRWWDLGAEVN
jgi:hypothetical protein